MIEDEEEGERDREIESAPVSKLASWIAQVYLQACVRVRIQYNLNYARARVLADVLVRSMMITY